MGETMVNGHDATWGNVWYAHAARAHVFFGAQLNDELLSLSLSPQFGCCTFDIRRTFFEIFYWIFEFIVMVLRWLSAWFGLNLLNGTSWAEEMNDRIHTYAV